nr:hypothetical protein [Tanacetum cinerariifolium]
QGGPLDCVKRKLQLDTDVDAFSRYFDLCARDVWLRCSTDLPQPADSSSFQATQHFDSNPMLKQPTHLGFSITADSTHFGPSTSNQIAFSEGAYVNTIGNTPAVHNQLPNPPSVNLQGRSICLSATSIHGSTSGAGQRKRTHKNTQAESAASKEPSLKRVRHSNSAGAAMLLAVSSVTRQLIHHHGVQVNKRNMSMVPKFLLMALCVPAGSSSCDSAGHIEAVPDGYDIVPAGHVLVSADRYRIC